MKTRPAAVARYRLTPPPSVPDRFRLPVKRRKIAVVLINKHPKLSCHKASMPINDRRLIKPVMFQQC